MKGSLRPWVGLLAYLAVLVATASARHPSYDILPSALQGRRRLLRPTLAVNTNSFLRQSQATPRISRAIRSSRPYQRLLLRRNLLDLFDPLEPLELLWEFYCKRYEILDEVLTDLSHFARKRSARAVVYFVGALGAAEILARLGVLGKKHKSLKSVIKNSKRVNEGLEERIYQKTSSFLLDHIILVFSKFRRFGNKSKFAIAVSAGGLFGRFSIRATVVCVKTVMISFFVLETASFLGIVGDVGESVLDWVDDERERGSAWTMKVARWHKVARKSMNLEVLQNLYEACVDEEKIASFGFSVGTVLALLTC
jgi:hypothetical protein